MAKTTSKKSVETLKHDEAKRRNIPSAEHQSVMDKDLQKPRPVKYPRNTDLDPQLVWHGKDEQNWTDLVVQAPPLYIQEKVHPKALIDDLLRDSKERADQAPGAVADLFADFNGIPKGVDRTEFYQHDQNWSNRMILGDSLQVMASLSEREALRGKVQCIYFDPPYGIKFNSNFQWSTTSRDVKDGNATHITREPEQVKAFRDTWRDGIHSYLTYLRDRLTVARDLLTDSGSIFVQIGDENVHRVRVLMDEVLGDDNFAALITFRKKMMPLGSDVTEGVSDYLLWYAKHRRSIKSRPLFYEKNVEGEGVWVFSLLPDGRRVPAGEDPAMEGKLYQAISLLPAQYRENQDFSFDFEGRTWGPPKSNSWKTDRSGMQRLLKANRLHPSGNTLRYILHHHDYPVGRITNSWNDVTAAAQQVYVVQTNVDVVKRCILMSTDPGDLVLDPTCGSGTAAFVAEQWGRRWVTIDTSRVALALARARLMGARYPYYLLADSREGQRKMAEVENAVSSVKSTGAGIRLGFVYERVPHVTLGSIANNAEIDAIWEKWQKEFEPLRELINRTLKKSWQEWEVPREADSDWPDAAKRLLEGWWEARIARQKEIDASIASKAQFEKLFDKPYEDKKKVRVAGPFTVESVSPHRMLGVSEDGTLIGVKDPDTAYGPKKQTFAEMILENLRTAGVQQAKKSDRIEFTSIRPWPGRGLICAEGRYHEGNAEAGAEKRAAILIGPEFGTVTRIDLTEAAREAGEAGFDVLIACAFSYEAHATELEKLGRVPVLKARMNADLHMAGELKNTGKGNLFVIFGEPDIDLDVGKDGVRVTVKGVDVFDPSTGRVRTDEIDDIACWFIDSEYNGESFFVRHAYFLGANDPYGALKTTLKAEIDREAWESLHSATSRLFPKPKTGRIAVKVINHLGDEVMKVFKVN
jgi:adenine-specific DNA-methyltransferase